MAPFYRPRLLSIAIYVVSAVCTGCWFFSPNPPPVVPIKVTATEPMAQDDADLFARANQQNTETSTLKELSNAVAGYEELRTRMASGPSPVSWVEVSWRLAKALFLASEAAGEPSEKLRWIARGEEVAEEMVTDRPDRVEGYYFGAVLKGRRAQYSTIGLSAMKLAKVVEALGQKAMSIDAGFAEGGPLRLLAMLYAKAPPWPTSVGDIDKALELAQRAVTINDYPLNHLIYAEVLIEDDQLEEARSELSRVLAAPKIGHWATEGEVWRPYAMDLLRHLDE